MSNPNPIRCFDGNDQPHQPFWKWANVETALPELEIDGVLSQFSWYEDEITPKLFKDQLYANGKGGPVLMKLNSPGGDVIAAAKMRAIMSDYPGEITVRIEGLAASAAVIVAIAAQKVQITDAAYMMIHDPSVVVFFAQLDIQTLAQLRDNLQTIKDGIIPAYAAKTGLTEGVIANMMTRETWMSAREAVDLKFADEIISGGQKPKSQINNLAYVNVLRSYSQVPAALNAVMEASTDSLEDCQEVCETALEYCIECMQACEACPDANDPLHQQCIAISRQAIEACAVCVHDCDEAVEGTPPTQLLNSIQMCAEACRAATAAARACAQSCPTCQGTCTVCADACQLCETVCNQMLNPINQVNILSARSSSQTESVDIERAVQQLRDYVQLYK